MPKPPIPDLHPRRARADGNDADALAPRPMFPPTAAGRP
jgi:hypothetical protein